MKMKKRKKIIIVAALTTISSLAIGVANVSAIATAKVAENTKINYEIQPEITVDMPSGFENELPNAVLNKSYDVPTASAIDVYGDELTVQTALYAHYYSETRSLIQIENNAFIPTFYGVYTVCYTASDVFGNAAVETFDIVCQEKLPLMATVGQASGEYFVGREIEVADISFENAIGETLVEVTAICAQASYRMENGCFTPEYEGEYTIEYVYSDYSETNKISYTIIVQANETPIFNSEITLPDYFILGATYALPTVEGKAYRNNAIYSVAPSISARYSNFDYAEDIVDGAFTPCITGDVVIKYELNCFGKSETKEYSVKVVDVNFNGAMKMEKYFYADEDVGLNATSYGVEITTLKDGASAEFINSVLSRTLTMTLGISDEDNNFTGLDIYLTDAEDELNKVKISFEATDGNAKIIVNDVDYAYASIAFDAARNVPFEYFNAARTISLAGSAEIEVKETLSGDSFEGFGEFIMVKYVMRGVTGRSTFSVYSIDNQTFSNEKGDGMRPYIYFSTYKEGNRLVGDLIEIERIYVADILDPNYTVQYYVLDPSGKFVVSLDGEQLDMDTDHTQEYSFIATEKGKYTVYMEVSDSVGNKELYAYSINVIDTQAPDIVLSGVKSEVKAGKSINLAMATVTDDITSAEEIKVFVVVICPNWETVMAENGKEFAPDQYGTYTVYYYVTDGDGNVAMQSYQFTVK